MADYTDPAEQISLMRQAQQQQREANQAVIEGHIAASALVVAQSAAMAAQGLATGNFLIGGAA